MDQYAVIGHPIKHSRSPWIHSQFARTCEETIEYGLLESEPTSEAFLETIHQFISGGGKGVNVTMPFKEMAWDMAEELTERATLAGAVNTLTFSEGGKISGDTTDGVGLVNDLAVNMKIALKHKKILILGAGGAVKGVLQPLLAHNPDILHIVNRTVQRAEELAETFNEYGAISAGSYQDLSALGAFDIVINATPTNFSGELPPILPDVFSATALAYDMSYAAESTQFERWSAENGAAKVNNGLGMLVEQGAESFFIWRGVRPSTEQVLIDLRKAL